MGSREKRSGLSGSKLSGSKKGWKEQFPAQGEEKGWTICREKRKINDRERWAKGVFVLAVVKSTVRSVYRGFLILFALSFLLLSTVLLLAFLANPQLMWESVQQAFGMVK